MAKRQMKNPTYREVDFVTWWGLFNDEMVAAGLPAPGMQYAQDHYEMGQSPSTALSEALAGNL